MCCIELFYLFSERKWKKGKHWRVSTQSHTLPKMGLLFKTKYWCPTFSEVLVCVQYRLLFSSFLGETHHLLLFHLHVDGHRHHPYACSG